MEPFIKKWKITESNYVHPQVGEHYPLLKDTLPPLPDMLLEPPDKPEKLLHPDHAHEDLDMDLAMRPVLLGQRLLYGPLL